MRVLVCGSRNFDDVELLTSVLDKINITTIITGMARGADSFAYVYALKGGIEVASYTADWGQYGKAAGMIRNQLMLDEGKPDLVVAFPVGKSIGTRGMIRISREAGVEVAVHD